MKIIFAVLVLILGMNAARAQEKPNLSLDNITFWSPAFSPGKNNSFALDDLGSQKYSNGLYLYHGCALSERYC